jgi:hypothetical protein
MTIRIISDGLYNAGAPLNIGNIKSFDAATEASIVSTGKAVYIGQGGFGGINAIWQQHTPVSVPAVTTESIVYSFTVPGNTMGPNDTLRVTTLWTTTSSANNKICAVKFGGSTVGTFTVTTSATYKEQRQMSNRGVQNSQVVYTTGNGGFGTSNTAVGTLSVDTSQDQVLTVSGTKASAGETLTLESVVVEIIAAAKFG